MKRGRKPGRHAPVTTEPISAAMYAPAGNIPFASAVAMALTRHYRGEKVPQVVYDRLRLAAGGLIEVLLEVCPPSPERSTAVAKTREALMWGIASVVIEPMKLER